MKESRTEEGLKAKMDYINNWKRERKKIFSATLNKEEVDEITAFLKKKQMNKSEFVRWAYSVLKRQ